MNLSLAGDAVEKYAEYYFMRAREKHIQFNLKLYTFYRRNSRLMWWHTHTKQVLSHLECGSCNTVQLKVIETNCSTTWTHSFVKRAKMVRRFKETGPHFCHSEIHSQWIVMSKMSVREFCCAFFFPFFFAFSNCLYFILLFTWKRKKKFIPWNLELRPTVWHKNASLNFEVQALKKY